MGETATANRSLEFGILGPFAARSGGTSLPLAGRQQRAILALLVCEAGHAVSFERLVAMLWGEAAPSGAVTSLQTYIFRLRQVLEPARPRGSPGTILVTEPGGYRLDVDPQCIDRTRFEDMVLRADAALARPNPELALTVYEEALSLWRGDVLADLADYDFVGPVRTRLEEMRLSALQSRIEAELGLGLHAAVVAELAPLIVGHPLREGLHAQRMLALYRSGRQSDALAAYRELRSLLNAELGIEPSPPLRELNNRILAQDPALGWQPPGGRTVSTPFTTPSIEPTTERTSESATTVHHVVRGRLGMSRFRVRASVAVVAGAAALAVATLRPWSGQDAANAMAANAVTEIDESGSVVASVAVGTNPIAVASARGAIWVTNAGDDTVSKVDPTTHSVQRVVDVGRVPQSLAVTGDDLWVANFADGTVSRINVRAARVVDTIRVGSGPAALATGPAGLWVANSGANTIQRIDTTSGATDAPIDVGDGPDGLAVDATSIWAANGRAGSVTRVDASSGEQMSAPIRVGSGPRGIVRAGDDVWVADELSQSLTRIDIGTGRTHSINVGDGPTAVAVHRGAVWVAERYSGDLLRINPDTELKTRVDARGAVRGLAVVNGHMWVTSGAVVSTVHEGGTLRVAAGSLPGQISGLDPANVYDRVAWHANRVVYDGLLTYHYASADPQVLVPDLATSVPEPTDGGRTYTFNLRPGIRYSTGDPVKASDLVRGVRRALLATTGRPDFYAGIVGGQACIDDATSCDLSRGVMADDVEGRVTFHLTAPDPLFLHNLTLMVVPAPPGTPLRKLTSPLPGTGPYRISSFTQGKKLSLARNKFFHEWSAGAQPSGFVDAITWLKVSDARAAAHAVMRGRADLAELTPLGGWSAAAGSLVDELRTQAPSSVHSSLVQATSFGVLNSSAPPFDNLKARQGFNYAVDRTTAVQIMGGPSVAVATCQLVPPSMPSYEPYCPYTAGRAVGAYRGPDLAKARQLVKASGTYAMKVTVTDLVDDFSPPLDSYFAHVLRRLGYRVALHRLPDNARNERLQYDPRSGIQVESGGWIADFPLPSNFYDVVSCRAPAYPTGYCNRDLDRRAAAATSQLQTDPGAALRTWTAINRAVTDQAALVPVTNDVNWWITSERVGNYQSGGREVGPLISQLWVR
jgi:YVTN family beta-propeller protein